MKIETLRTRKLTVLDHEEVRGIWIMKYDICTLLFNQCQKLKLIAMNKDIILQYKGYRIVIAILHTPKQKIVR